MVICAPRITSPISECSRSVMFENAFPNATVILVVIRNGIQKEVGIAKTRKSTGIVLLNPGEEFITQDLVSIKQTYKSETSDLSENNVEVQKNTDKFKPNPPAFLSHLYHCSRGFKLGAMRPGTKVEVLNGTNVIGTGEVVDGTTRIEIDAGLPSAGTKLTARLHFCPKPPPPNHAPEWIIESELPDVVELQLPTGVRGTLPPPVITSGLTDCSRSLQISDIIPGAEVMIEVKNLKAWLATYDNSSGSIELAVPLAEGETVKVYQYVGKGCEMQSQPSSPTVGKYEKLKTPELDPIECSDVSTVTAHNLTIAKIQYEIVYQNNKYCYETYSSHIGDGPIPAPPKNRMPPGAKIRIRQGLECTDGSEKWSDWSDPPTLVNTFTGPINQHNIVGELYQCQGTITVENIVPPHGSLRIISDFLGDIANIPVTKDRMTICVAPSLQTDDTIHVEHTICGLKVEANKKVNPLTTPGAGQIVGPVYVGDTSVSVKDVTAGAYVELWYEKETEIKRLDFAYAPSSDNGKSTVIFSNFGTLTEGNIYIKFWYCGQHGQTGTTKVTYRAPVLDNLVPPSVNMGSGKMTLTAKGSNFLNGAELKWGGQTRPTTFVSSSEVKAEISASDVSLAGNVSITVVNIDNQSTLPKQFVIEPPPHVKPMISANWESNIGPSRNIIIGGSGFKSGEFITIDITSYENGNPTGYVDTFNVQADSSGILTTNRGVTCGTIAGLTVVWQVIAHGGASGDSNTVGVTC
ncbi:hypothetical protein [Bacillus thuringiensis]|uniref:hypothetical protein n=1 Tax=Bacillus thuringiensis TaxID=1428 RepID=UPI0011A2E2D8|nr:hypothetical protein [Bacillus thuringiensis]